MKIDGNHFLLQLFDGDESKMLDFIFSSLHFFDKETVDVLNNVKENKVRLSKKITCFFLENEQLKPVIDSKNKLSRMKEFAAKQNLFIKDKDGGLNPISFDKNGNYAITKVLKSEMKMIFGKKDHELKNYIVSHVWSNPITLEIHNFRNIILVPTFLDHFIDKGLLVDNKNVLNVLKLLMRKILDMKEDPDGKIDSKYTIEEEQYANELISKNKLKFLSKSIIS